MDLHAFINQVLIEDLSTKLIDHTCLACIPPNAEGKAQLLVKQAGILAGVSLAQQIFEIIDPSLQLNIMIPDGTPVQYGNVAFIVQGKQHSILKAERTVLNCMQRMSGVATLTHQYLQAIIDTNATLLDTRKTTPNFRYFEKMAVKIAGAQNHRFGLYDMIMIKDNHHDACGGISNAIAQTKQYLKNNNLQLPVEIEVRNLTELKQVLQVGQGTVTRIMFDNFTPEQVQQALQLTQNHPYQTEASGGITLENIRQYALTGVNFISVGALTHSYKSLDMSLKVIK